MMSKFLPVSALRDKEVDYKNRTIQLQGKFNDFHIVTVINSMHRHADTRLTIGFVTQQQANSFLEEGDIHPRQLASFYDGVRAFFERAVDYSLKSLPLDERATADSLHAEYFINRLAILGFCLHYQ